MIKQKTKPFDLGENCKCLKCGKRRCICGNRSYLDRFKQPMTKKVKKYKYSRREIAKIVETYDFNYDKFIKKLFATQSQPIKEKKPCSQCLNPDQKGICSCGRNWYFDNEERELYLIKQQSKNIEFEEIEEIKKDGEHYFYDRNLPDKINQLIRNQTKLINLLNKRK